MRILVIIALALTLTACGSKKTLQVEEKSIVVMPPEGLWNCPNAPVPPANITTQDEVADYVLRLYEAHQVCEASMEAVRRYLERAKLITEKDD